jgi:bacterioferritin-associated ferredoxin
MYICICNAIRESDFRRAGRRTCGDAESVYAALGKRPQCGQCLEDAGLLLEEERARAPGLTLVAA